MTKVNYLSVVRRRQHWAKGLTSSKNVMYLFLSLKHFFLLLFSKVKQDNQGFCLLAIGHLFTALLTVFVYTLSYKKLFVFSRREITFFYVEVYITCVHNLKFFQSLYLITEKEYFLLCHIILSVMWFSFKLKTILF